MTDCIILLDNNPSATYYAGQFVRGTVELQLPASKKFNGLFFLITGTAKTHWKQPSIARGRETQTEFEGEETFLSSKCYLFGSRSGSAVVLPAGNHRYAFEYHLSPFMPSSLEASHGSISYNIEFILDVPWWFNRKFQLPLTVIRNDNLNDFPNLRLPVQHEAVQKFYSWIFFAKNLVMTVMLPCSGYTPGTEIPVTVKFDNNSDTAVDLTKINFIKTVCFKCEKPYLASKYKIEKMIEVYGEGVGINGATSSFTKVLNLPLNMLKTNTRYCNILQVSYEITVEAEISDNETMLVKIPITIGDVPLNLTSNIVTQRVIARQAPTLYPAHQSPSTLYPDLPPPSYDETMNTAHQGTSSNEQFGSRYNVLPQKPTAPTEH